MKMFHVVFGVVSSWTRVGLLGVVFIGTLLSVSVRADKSAGLQSEKSPVAVLLDNELPLYNVVLAGLALEVDRPLSVFHLAGAKTMSPETQKKLEAMNSDMIVAVGPTALASLQDQDVPVVFSMVPRLESYRFRKTNIAGASLDVPYETQLTLLKSLLPNSTRLGVPHDPDISSSTIDALNEAAAKTGHTVVPLPVADIKGVKSALEVGGFDLLLMISDPVVLQLASYDVMKAYSASQKVPIIALNARYVAQGALLSLQPDFVSMGRLIGKISQRVMNGDAPSEIGSVAPGRLQMTMSVSAVSRLNVDAGFYERAAKVAAEQKLSLKYFK